MISGLEPACLNDSEINRSCPLAPDEEVQLPSNLLPFARVLKSGPWPEGNGEPWQVFEKGWDLMKARDEWGRCEQDAPPSGRWGYLSIPSGFRDISLIECGMGTCPN